MTNLDSVLKRRDITLPMKVELVKALVFPIVIYGCESWIIKKADRWRIAAFELWCWRRLLRVPWTAKRFNQSILKEISLEYSLEELRLKPKCQYFGHLMWRTARDPDTGKYWRWEEKGTVEDEMVGWHHRLMDMSSVQELVLDRDASHAVVHGVAELDTTEWLNWTDWTLHIH